MAAARTILMLLAFVGTLAGLASQSKPERPSAPGGKPGGTAAAPQNEGPRPTPGGQGEDPVSSSSPMKLVTPETEALSEFEKRTRYLLKKAEYHFFNKRFHTALRFLKQLKEHDPENYLAYAYSGDIHLTHEKLDLALENYRVALELSPDPARERFRMGQIFYLKKDSQKALEYFERALKTRPDFPLCRLYMGLVYLNQLQDKPRAIEHLKAYRDAAPGDPQAAQVSKLLERLADEPSANGAGSTNDATGTTSPAPDAKPAGPANKPAGSN